MLVQSWRKTTLENSTLESPLSFVRCQEPAGPSGPVRNLGFLLLALESLLLYG